MPTLIFSHAPIDKTFNFQSTTTAINHEAIQNILVAKNENKSGKVEVDGKIIPYNFTKYDNTIISLNFGHVHFQYCKPWNKINVFTGLQSSGMDPQKNTYWDTDKEDAFYIMEVDLMNRNVNIKGYGRATDLSYKF